MTDYFEIDFLDVKTEAGTTSGDAIPLRYQLNGETYIHVVDGGYVETGAEVIAHIKEHYGNPARLDNVVVTHHDGDHANGLRAVLKEFDVDALWMLRPWLYAEELLPRFARFTSAAGLERRLREIYPNLVALEEIALEKGIDIYDPFQGKAIGAFRVLAPSRSRYLDLIVESDKTPDAVQESATRVLADTFARALASAVSFVKSLWGAESLPPKETSAENEMSVVQFAHLCDQRIVLTGDAGRHALTEAADFGPSVGLHLPGVGRFQIPHHGSRHNVHTELLDRWFGPRHDQQVPAGSETFTAIVCAAKKDKDHPRKAVVRGFMHRGAKVISPGDSNGTVCTFGGNHPSRGWGPVTPLPYPNEQEE